MTTKTTTTSIQPGVSYAIEHIRGGAVLSREVVHNLTPIEGLNHIASVVAKGAAQVPTWYIGLFEGNYTPIPGDTAAGFPAAAVETTTYAPSTRVEFNEGAVTGGVVDNTANRAEFTFTTGKTIYGAFMSSGQAKGSVTGVLISAARFGSPKAVLADDVLRVTASLEFLSA